MATLIKKIIIVLLWGTLTNQKKRDFARKSASQATTFSTQYPTFINPTPAAMITLCDEGDAISEAKDVAVDNVKTLTQNEQANLVTILLGLNIWVLLLQGFAGLTVALVTQLGWSVKATGTDNRVDMMASNPAVVKSNQSTSKTIILDLVNSTTTKKGKPYGAKGWIPFYQIGGTKPTVHDTMTMGIPTGKMSYKQTVGAASLNQQLYVCFVWYDGTELIGPDSPIYSFTMI
jgi:hypothetical protein